MTPPPFFGMYIVCGLRRRGSDACATETGFVRMLETGFFLSSWLTFKKKYKMT